MRASSYLLFINISKFGRSPSYNGAFQTRTRTSNAQQRGAAINLAALGRYIPLQRLHARGDASACSPFPGPLLLLFLTRFHLEPPVSWLSGRKTFFLTPDKSIGSPSLPDPCSAAHTAPRPGPHRPTPRPRPPPRSPPITSPSPPPPRPCFA